MASVKSVYLENFQSHQKTKIDLTPAGQLTVVVGPTDSGKTAVVRALRWLFYNVPQGLDFIRAGAHAAAVAVETDDGTKIVRERSKSVNRYRIARPDSQPTVFEGFGISVPAEVQEATGVRTVTVGDLELALNLSEQLDGPFLGQKSVSGPARAKILGKLAGTEEVDEAQRGLAADIYRATQEERRLLAEIEDLDARIGRYDYLPAMAVRIEALESAVSRARAAEERAATLQALRARLRAVLEQADAARATVERWRTLDAAQAKVAAAEAGAVRNEALLRLKLRRMDTIAGIQGARKVVSRWSSVELADAARVEAENALQRAGGLEGLRRRLALIREQAKTAREVAVKWREVDRAAEIAAGCESSVQRGKRLVELRRRHSQLTDAIEAARRGASRWASIDQAVGTLLRTEEAARRVALLVAAGDRLAGLRQSRVLAENRLFEVTRMVRDAESQYAETLLKAGRCPVCGSTVDPIRLKEAV